MRCRGNSARSSGGSHPFTSHSYGKKRRKTQEKQKIALTNFVNRAILLLSASGFCPFLLMHLIPARGRKPVLAGCPASCPASMHLIPARGRKPFRTLLVVLPPPVMHLIPARGRKPHGLQFSPFRYVMHLIPARGRKRVVDEILLLHFDASHPREGTETMMSYSSLMVFLMHLIPARGRKQDGGNVRTWLQDASHPREGTETTAFP